METSKFKLLIDTDNGTDIDDINTLYFALNNKFDIVGVVSSYLNTQRRVLQIEHVLDLFNKKDIPHFAGCGIPLKPLHGCDLNYVYNQYGAELGEQKSNDYNGEKAIDFIIDQAKKYGKNLVILEIAPETTLAKAILKDKEAFKDVHIQIMAGYFYQNRPEWNVECDYEAARIVLNSGAHITYIGCDVCDPTEIKDEMIKKLYYSSNDDPKLDYLVTCVNRWQKTESRGIILYDSIALLTLIDDKLCEFEEKKVNFFLENEHAYLRFDESGQLVKVAKTININRLYQYILKLFNEENDL